MVPANHILIAPTLRVHTTGVAITPLPMVVVTQAGMVQAIEVVTTRTHGPQITMDITSRTHRLMSDALDAAKKISRRLSPRTPPTRYAPLALLILALIAGFACDTAKKPSYEELQAENEQLKSQLDEVNEKVQQAKSDLAELRGQIEDLELISCHEDAASDMEQKADDVQQSLDEADDDSN